MDTINNIHWHDSEIESVFEVPRRDELIYNVLYPENWERNEFVAKAIVFEGYHSQIVEEMPFEGNPTILGASVHRKENDFTTFKLETNAGSRFVTAKGIRLVPQHITN